MPCSILDAKTVGVVRRTGCGSAAAIRSLSPKMRTGHIPGTTMIRPRARETGAWEIASNQGRNVDAVHRGRRDPEDKACEMLSRGECRIRERKQIARFGSAASRLTWHAECGRVQPVVMLTRVSAGKVTCP